MAVTMATPTATPRAVDTLLDAAMADITVATTELIAAVMVTAEATATVAAMVLVLGLGTTTMDTPIRAICMQILITTLTIRRVIIIRPLTMPPVRHQ